MELIDRNPGSIIRYQLKVAFTEKDMSINDKRLLHLLRS
jgi:hypothetical protein